MQIAQKRKKRKLARMIVTTDNVRKIVGTNLRRLRKGHKLTLEKLAELAETSAQYLSAIESGKRGMGPDLLTRLCNVFKVNSSEFAGEVEELKPLPPPAGEIAVISMGEGGPNGFYEEAYPPGHGFRYIKRPYDVTDPRAYAVEVRGSSMSPRYEEGEVVVASPQKEVCNGDYVVVKLATGEVMVKRIKFRAGIIILSSVNPAVDAWICNPEEVIFYHKIVWKKEKS